MTLSERIAAAKPKPKPEPKKPAWLARLTARDQTGALR